MNPKIVDQITALPKDLPLFLAVGTFDGLHLGHQYLLNEMIKAAKKQLGHTAVLTFLPHPRLIIEPDSSSLYLTDYETRNQLLQNLPLDWIINYPFNQETRETTATEFINELCQATQLTQLWGADFTIGYQREGNFSFLQQLGKEKQFTVHKLTEKITLDNAPISSSRIRKAIQTGAIQEANACLGRPFALSGIVVHGEKRGQTIGIPTANLSVWPHQLLPPDGVYATFALIDGQKIPAATNIGIRPTVSGKERTIEAHLLDFSADLYDKKISLQFLDHLRPEQKFTGLPQLLDQIQLDITRVRQIVEDIS